MENKNNHGISRKQIMKGPASRATRLKRKEIRNRDEKKIGRFGEWMIRRETKDDAPLAES